MATSKKTASLPESRRALIRVSLAVHSGLKVVAAIKGVPVYEVTNEALERYLLSEGINEPLKAIRLRKSASRK
jgi:hypothetical protein